DIHVETDQLGGEGGQPLILAFAIAVLDGDVLALHIAELAQSSAERLIAGDVRGGHAGRENSDAGNSWRLLRFGRSRSKDAESENDRESDQPHRAREARRK